MSSISKAFILGAGLGTRLQPLTHSLPKPLVPIANRPLVEHTLDACIEAGITSFIINTHHLAEEWSKAFPKQTYRGYPITFSHEPILLDTGGGLKQIESFFQGESILVVNGDIMSNLSLKDLMQQHSQSEATTTLALLAEGPNCNIALNGNLISDLRYERGIHAGTHQFSGIYCTRPAILEQIPKSTPKSRPVSIIPTFLKLAEAGKLEAFLSPPISWNDLGTREVYLKVNQQLALTAEHPAGIHPEAVIHPSAKVDATSTIGAGVIIAEGCEVKHSVIWPKAVLSKNTKLDHCIVRQHASGNHSQKDL